MSEDQEKTQEAKQQIERIVRLQELLEDVDTVRYLTSDEKTPLSDVAVTTLVVGGVLQDVVVELRQLNRKLSQVFAASDAEADYCLSGLRRLTSAVEGPDRS